MKLTKPWHHIQRPCAMPVAARLAIALLLMLSLSHCAQFSALQSGSASEPAAAGEPATATAQPQTEPSLSTGNSVAGISDAPIAEPKPELGAEFQQAFTEAKQRLRAEDYQAAATLLEPLAEAFPAAGGIIYNLAVCYWQLQQVEQAQQQLTQLLERQPGYVEAANLLGVIARQQGNFNQARRYWLDALAQQSDFASAHKNLGFLYELYLAQPAQARYHYQQYQQLTADPMAEAWLSLLEQQE
ncbi:MULTISPECIES: tetratricopeptide repeat protein [unclassified Arsukibacterium]|uniref:tetratricopeptide repeat protein n=1 Tax=unclassified Arsukibacterium TaxID=2635278 RepID=UPI000C59FB58|nr:MULTISPECIES: tetratricopeptide repeat protein [unclassified Arsukibacterium]MAA96339.1 hypothetical protein [Rheinheimera sp.]MBM33819.1 hypothetical protein [Rheinheimera sp.]HAW93221.1 hypothetical protein [Candidatus Azambacteria bacterium]